MAFEPQIADIDIKVSVQDFENQLRSDINALCSSISYKITPVSTRRGKNMHKVELEEQSCGTFTIIAEVDANTGDMIFRPLILSSLNNSFYQTNYHDADMAGTSYDPAYLCLETLCNLARAHGGNFAFITSDARKIIDHGQHKTARYVALVDDEGHVFSCGGAQKVSGDRDDTSFTVNVPIGEWLKDHVDIQQAIATLPLDQKMNLIGKWLVNARIAEEIESDEFMDIFRQAGIIGFSEPSVLNIYKLIM